MWRSRGLTLLVLANLAVSILHFSDNALHFERYPEPKWITGPHIVAALWVGITGLLALGWWLAQRGRTWPAIAVLWVYGALSAFALGHYLYGSPQDLTSDMNALIIAETAAAVLLMVLAPRLVLPR
jgi:hypothetical protein